MDDWAARGRRPGRASRAAAGRARTGPPTRPRSTELAELVGRASARARRRRRHRRPRRLGRARPLAERLGCPVWQESFSGRAGFPQDHPLLRRAPARRPRGPPRRRSRPTTWSSPSALPRSASTCGPGPVRRAGHHRRGRHRGPPRSIAAPPTSPSSRRRPPSAAALATRRPARDGTAVDGAVRGARAARPPAADEPFAPAHVFAALAERLPADSILIEEAPSTRARLLDMLPAREPARLPQPGHGRPRVRPPRRDRRALALPERPVVAVVGDGASLYTIQTLWSAAHYDVGRALRDPLQRRLRRHGPAGRAAGGAPPWPSFGDRRLHPRAGFGCPARRIEDHDELLATLDEVIPQLGSRASRCCSTSPSSRTRASRREIPDQGRAREGSADARIPPSRSSSSSGRFPNLRRRPTCSCGSAVPACAPPICTRSTG